MPQGLNLIVLFSEDGKKILFCRRRKDPYKGLLNFVGGHIEPNEKGTDAAYRELQEETSVTASDVQLTYLLKYEFPMADEYMEVYAGRLKKEIFVHGSENELLWSTWEHDFFDVDTYAGEGTVGQILAYIRTYAGDLLT